MNRNLTTQVGFCKFETVLKRRVLTATILGALLLAPVVARSATAGSFALVLSMKQFRRLHTATLLLNGRVLVAGGAPFLPAATSEIFDPLTETWTNSGPLTRGANFTQQPCCRMVG